MVHNLVQEQMMYAVYFAPRGKKRLYNLGHQLAQRHLNAADNLIGFVGDAGAGKSQLIRGMFPGLELTNDDEGINIRPVPLLDDMDCGFFSAHTYHIDIRFESAFTQMHVIRDAVLKALAMDRRVIIEHFDLLYPSLGMNAQILIGIGEEVFVTRPTIFGPLPEKIAAAVLKSINYRKMAHTAEDITCKILEDEYNMEHTQVHGDIKHGFLLEFDEKPNIDIQELEDKVKDYIDMGIDIRYVDDSHIGIGDSGEFHCTGPRIHVNNTSEIENFRFIKDFVYDPMQEVFVLIGLVGNKEDHWWNHRYAD